MSSDTSSGGQLIDLDQDYEIISTEEKDLVALINPNNDSFRTADEYSVSPQEIPLVLHTSRDIVKGYIPEGIKGREAYDIGEAYLEGREFHITQNNERWEMGVKMILDGIRQDVTEQNKDFSSRRKAYTRPSAGNVSREEDDCWTSNYDPATEFDFS